ncbi:MAG: hypothetical protein SVZ03_12365 [Spirochaetota bacterium]|nr:hypothetical protein [Spirochaetota bacterium]
MTIPGNLLTTAMAVMPHRDIEQALELALIMDIPFWPQLPHLSYYEDMYVQASEHFPGIMIDIQKRSICFSMDKFIEEYEETFAHYDETEYFDISKEYSSVYHRFLELDLSDRPAIRGQLEGPISFGFNVLDQDNRPILYDDTIRPIMLEIMSKRINAQLNRLKKKNANAFMYIDEPGLQFIFNAMSGYNDIKAHDDIEAFLCSIERPRGIHLCGNPDWDFLLRLDLDILSLDVYTNSEVFVQYAPSIKRFLDRGGIISWGIVPTNIEPFEREGIDSLEKKITDIWNNLDQVGIDRQFLISKSLLSPATCCLINPDGEKTVEKAFSLVKQLSLQLRDKYICI